LCSADDEAQPRSGISNHMLAVALADVRRMNMSGEGQVALGLAIVLQGLGVDLADVHLKDTPWRAARAWHNELCAGLTTPEPVVTAFDYGGTAEMQVLRDIPVHSMCAHHLLPFVGTAQVGYVSGNQKLIGLSKLARIVDHFARRPQVQEQLTTMIADYLWERVGDQTMKRPGGVGVVIRANHFCMELRGVKHKGDMVTSALRGVFEEGRVRSEFMALVKNGA